MTFRNSLAQKAIECLHFASDHRSLNASGERTGSYAARKTVAPDTWLLERCWHVLTAEGYGTEALSVASMAEVRQPLAPMQALQRLARSAQTHPHVVPLVQNELLNARERLFSDHLFAEPTHQVDYLLYATAAAAFIDELHFATSCLERLDQLPKSWDRIFVHPELRQTLAEAVACIGLTTLTKQLMNQAIMYFSESGAQFLQQVATATHLVSAGKGARLLDHCVAVVQRAVLGSLHSRKVAASILARAGLVDELLEQIRTIATIQDAHRETNAMLNQRGSSRTATREEVRRRGGTDNSLDIAEIATITASERSRAYPVHRSASATHVDSSIVRQVSRTSADTDVDFLVYALKGAVESLDLAQLSADHRRILINQLAALGVMSDGWTAAGATAALLRLNGVQEAIDVVVQISPADPTRVEGVLALVQGLLDLGNVTAAQEQAVAALAWADELQEKTPGRTLQRELATLFVDHGLPEYALEFLSEEETERPEWRHAMYRFLTGRWFGDDVSEEQLLTDRLRFAAYLKQMMAPEETTSQNGQNLTQENLQKEQPTFGDEAASVGFATLDGPLPNHIDQLARELSGWAAYYLDGEALVSFYLHSLLFPLLQAGRFRYAWGLLPHLKEAVLGLQSNKMAARIEQICQPMAEQIAQSPQGQEAPVAAMQESLEAFLMELWEECATRGVWPTIYAIEGALRSMVTLRGPETLVEIAEAATEEGMLWEVA